MIDLRFLEEIYSLMDKADTWQLFLRRLSQNRFMLKEILQDEGSKISEKAIIEVQEGTSVELQEIIENLIYENLKKLNEADETLEFQ